MPKVNEYDLVIGKKCFAAIYKKTKAVVHNAESEAVSNSYDTVMMVVNSDSRARNAFAAGEIEIVPVKIVPF